MSCIQTEGSIIEDKKSNSNYPITNDNNIINRTRIKRDVGNKPRKISPLSSTKKHLSNSSLKGSKNYSLTPTYYSVCKVLSPKKCKYSTKLSRNYSNSKYNIKLTNEMNKITDKKFVKYRSGKQLD